MPDEIVIPRSFADLLADIIEANGGHPWDGGMSEQIDKDGYTTAGRRRMVEQLREKAKRDAG